MYLEGQHSVIPCLSQMVFFSALAGDLSMVHKSARRTEIQNAPVDLGNDVLLRLCRDRQDDASHERFCLELFRRAVSGEDETCWEILYENYKGLLCHWILKFARSVGYEVEDLDTLVVDTLAAFWSAFTVGKLAESRGLGSVLTYLKACAVTAVQQEMRIQARLDRQNEDRLALEEVEMAVPDERLPDSLVGQQMDAQRLWQIVRQACNDEDELLLAELNFSMGLKPAEIVARYPDDFPSVDDVYSLLRNLRNRLRRNNELRQLWTKTDSVSLRSR